MGSNKKRVLFIIDHLGVGGVQEFILNYIKVVREHKVTVLSLFGNDIYSKKIEEAGGEVIFLSKLNYGYLNILTFRVFWRFQDYLKSNIRNFDVIRVKLFAAFLYSSILKLYKYDKVYAEIDCRDKQLPLPIRIMYFLFANMYSRFYLPREYWQEYRYLRIKNDRLMPTKYFVTKRFSEKPFVFKHSYNIISIGRFIEQKGFMDVVRLFSVLIKYSSRDMGLYIIGDGPYKQKVEDYISKNQINNIYLLGSVSNLEDYLVPSDMIIKMAKGEGVNSVVRESLMIGKIVVSTLETEECKFLSDNGILFKIYRNNLDKSAKYIAELINLGVSDETQERIKQFAHELWGDELVKKEYL